MHKLLLFPLSLLLFSAAAFAVEKPASTTSAAGGEWKSLFDGGNTDAWKSIKGGAFPEQGWMVEDGVLKHVAKGGGGDIVTKEHFDNFELQWEWRVAPGGNGGLKYNLIDPTKAVGCEYQLLDDERHPDGKAHGTTRQTAGLYDVLSPAADKKLHPAGQWNESRILVRGNHVEHWLNGGKTVEFEFGSEALKSAVANSKFKTAVGWGVKTKSPILLQDHGDEVSFRKIRIRTLTEK